MSRKLMPVIILSVIFLTGCGGPKSTASCQQNLPATKGRPVLVLTSPNFADGETIPRKFTGDGEDVSPELRWDNVPSGTRSFALICSDPDAPLGTFIHWVIYDLPADVRHLPEGMPKTGVLDNGARQGVNGFRKLGYNGPKPPPGRPHRYIFRLYALDTIFGAEPGISAGRLAGMMENHIIATAELTRIYGK
ncbi:MAG: YbhB/YbcL family Raf kinase inhibitor-like protein [candidate division WOR-3 bacterium]